MAEVWHAYDEVLRRPVALKLFRATGDGPESQRVAAEMHTLAGLSHRNLVTVHDAGTDGERPYLVMQLVDGPTLAARIAAPGGVARAEAARIGSDLAAGLAYAHQRGIVHRDVKPANVLLPTRDHDDAPTALLADFGIAHSVGQERLTGTGMTIGTASYLAPEQVTGRDVGPPADVYALGLVLLETLGAPPPWTGTPIEIAMARLTNPPVVPADLGAMWTPLLTTMTAADPAARPSAAQVREAIGGASLPTAAASTAVLHGAADPTARLDAAAPPPGATALLPATAVDDQRPRRRRLTAWVLAGVAAVAVVLAVVLATTSGSGEPTGTSGTPTPTASPATTSPAASAVAVTSAPTTPSTTASSPTTPGVPGNGPGGNGPPGQGPGGPKADKTKGKPGR